MPGSTDLDQMLATLTVSQRPGRFAVVGPLATAEVTNVASNTLDAVDAVIKEHEGWTMISDIEVCGDLCRKMGWPAGPDFAWLTLDVHSSLEAVGLTAAVAAALAAVEVPANVIAAYHHDHLLVPYPMAATAIQAIDDLRRRPG